MCAVPRVIARALPILLAGMLLARCAPAAAPDPRPLVLTTTTVFADMVRNVAGERVRVGSIVPAGAHVEEYEPRPADSRRVSEASLIFVNGLDLDTWAERLLGDRRAGAPVVTLSAGLPTIGDNPHLWFDVSLAQRYVEKIRDALVALDPRGAAAYAADAARYENDLTALDTQVRATIATIPAERRTLVTSHDAYPYFARAYGLTIVGYAQIEPGKDPPPAEVADLIEKIKAAHVPALFAEAGVSPRIIEMIASESGVTKIVTDMPTDSLLAAPADTYAGIMRTTADKIAQALR